MAFTVLKILHNLVFMKKSFYGGVYSRAAFKKEAFIESIKLLNHTKEAASK